MKLLLNLLICTLGVFSSLYASEDETTEQASPVSLSHAPEELFVRIAKLLDEKSRQALEQASKSSLRKIRDEDLYKKEEFHGRADFLESVDNPANRPHRVTHLVLDLTQNPTLEIDLSEILPHFPNLTVLRVLNGQLLNPVVGPHQQLTKLEHLVLDGCKIPGAHMPLANYLYGLCDGSRSSLRALKLQIPSFSKTLLGLLHGTQFDHLRTVRVDDVYLKGIPQLTAPELNHLSVKGDLDIEAQTLQDEKITVQLETYKKLPVAGNSSEPMQPTGLIALGKAFFKRLATFL